jgi:hypothetical protein
MGTLLALKKVWKGVLDKFIKKEIKKDKRENE